MVALSEERESGDDHDRVEEDVLVLDEELRGSIEFENGRMESRVDVGEESRSEGEGGQELNIGIVLRVIRDDYDERTRSATEPKVESWMNSGGEK